MVAHIIEYLSTWLCSYVLLFFELSATAMHDQDGRQVGEGEGDAVGVGGGGATQRLEFWWTSCAAVNQSLESLLQQRKEGRTVTAFLPAAAHTG